MILSRSLVLFLSLTEHNDGDNDLKHDLEFRCKFKVPLEDYPSSGMECVCQLTVKFCPSYTKKPKVYSNYNEGDLVNALDAVKI